MDESIDSGNRHVGCIYAWFLRLMFVVARWIVSRLAICRNTKGIMDAWIVHLGLIIPSGGLGGGGSRARTEANAAVMADEPG
jgi:hypothetical protein